jgi:hypothetical protein
MNLERMHLAGRRLKHALTLPCCFASLVLIGLLFLSPKASATCTTTTTNPNPNPNPESFVSPGDFNGDCKSDVLWQNSGTGEPYFWLMNGTAIGSQGGQVDVSSDWVIQGVGDFSGTGTADVLWRNSTSGEVYIWFMNGSSVTSQGSPGTVTTDWSIQAVGDFNGDGKADILWQNSTSGEVYVWLMNGLTITSQGSPATVSPSSGWNVVGVGDFNDDGKADILWQNDTSGEVYIWLMNGTGIASQGVVANSLSPNWAVLGVGDFDGNGTSDVLWQNSSTGQIYIWFMNGLTIASQRSPGSPSPPSSTVCCSGVGNGWSIVGVGDYDGSGRASILFRQLSTGEVYIWLMNGATIASQGSPGTIPAAWKIATFDPYGCSNNVYCNILSETNYVRANGDRSVGWGPGNPAPSATAGGPLNPVIWDPGAATVAQNWASQCGGLNHNPNSDGGENIYTSESTTTPVTITGKDAVDAWSAEAGNYTYNSTGGTCAAGDECGHFTQLAWRTTTAVGCGVAQCTTNSPNPDFPDYALVVCDYTPAGNWPGVAIY